jgi:carbonic anhydrase
MASASINRLIEGFRGFRRNYYAENRELFDSLARQGQAPKVMIIGCADSRVDPLLIVGAEPGEVFVVRNVANLVPPYAPDDRLHGTSAALEFAVLNLGVEHIVVLGHAQCGGVQALLDGPGAARGKDDFVTPWMSIARPARDKAMAVAAGRQRQRACEQATVEVSLGNLLTFPWIRSRVAAGKLGLHGWYFDLERGALMRFDAAQGAFTDV